MTHYNYFSNAKRLNPSQITKIFKTQQHWSCTGGQVPSQKLKQTNHTNKNSQGIVNLNQVLSHECLEAISQPCQIFQDSFYMENVADE